MPVKNQFANLVVMAKQTKIPSTPLVRSTSTEARLNRMAADSARRRAQLESLAKKAEAAARNAARRTAEIAKSNTPAELVKNIKLAQTANKKANNAINNFITSANWNRNALNYRKMLLNLGRGHGSPGISNASWLTMFKSNIRAYKKNRTGAIGTTMRINSITSRNKPVKANKANLTWRNLARRAWST